jgi:hypothetical protein
LLGHRLQLNERQTSRCARRRNFTAPEIPYPVSMVLALQLRALGALPQVMGVLGKVYQRCKTASGTAQKTAVQHVHPENARGCRNTPRSQNHGLYRLCRSVVNKAFWDALPADIPHAA